MLKDTAMPTITFGPDADYDTFNWVLRSLGIGVSLTLTLDDGTTVEISFAAHGFDAQGRENITGFLWDNEFNDWSTTNPITIATDAIVNVQID